MLDFLTIEIIAMENTIFIYAKDGKVKALNLIDAKAQAEPLLSDGWKHTATLDSCTWIEYLCNSCYDVEIEVTNLMLT
jgi:hypothetical protein